MAMIDKLWEELDDHPHLQSELDYLKPYLSYVSSQLPSDSQGRIGIEN